MKIKEFKKEIAASETKEVVEILETLDQKSRVLAKVYLTALGDRQELENRDSSRKRDFEEVSQLV